MQRRPHNASRRSCSAPVAAMLTVLLVLCLTMLCSGQYPWLQNSYPSYQLQAQAWLDGRLDLGQDYPWLELAIYEDRYYVSFPPFPSMLLLPFVAVFGTDFHDGWLALASAAIGLLCAARLIHTLRPRETKLWLLIPLLYLANGWLFIGLNAWVWFFAQNLCFTLCMASLLCATRGQTGAALLLLACAFGCRPMVLLYTPVLLYLSYAAAPQPGFRRWLLHSLPKALPALLLGCVYMALNQARFGSPFEFGHTYLPEFQRAAEGQFSLSYLPGNALRLLRLPALKDGRLAFDKFNGNAFYLLNPALLLGLAACIRPGESRRLRMILPGLLGLNLVIILCHRTLGGWQFGNRYLVDLLPFVLLGLLLHLPRGGKRWPLLLPLGMVALLLHVLETIRLYAAL